MERTLLHLLGLPQPELLAAIARHRRSGLEVEKDAEVKKLVQVRDSVGETLRFLLVTVANLSNRSAPVAILLQFLAREREEEVVQGLANLLLDNASSATSEGSQNALAVQYNTLKLLVAGAERLPSEVKERLLDPLVTLMRTSNQTATVTSLFARDVIYSYIYHLSVASGLDVEGIMRYGQYIVSCLEAEQMWVKPHCESLFLALGEVKDIIQLALSQRKENKLSSAEMIVEEVDEQSSSPKGLQQFEINMDLIKLIGEREFHESIVESSITTLRGEITELQDAMNALLRLSLLIGRRYDRTKSSTESNISLSIIKNLGEVSLRLLNDTKLSVNYQRIAAALLRELLGRKSDESALSKLLPLLEESRDGISLAAIELIAEGAYENPRYCMGRLDILLSGKKERHKRENAAQVLARIIEIRYKRRKDEPFSSFRSVDQSLVELLLSRLDDPLVDLRNSSAKAFCFLDPSRVVPSLSSMLCEKADEKRRAAAREALRSMAAGCEDVIGFAEAVTNVEGPAEQDAVFALGKTLAEAMLHSYDGESRLDDFLSVIVRECIEKSREKPLLIGLARRLGPFICEDPSRCAKYCAQVLTELEQARGEDAMAHLTPVLLLRVLPEIDLEDDELSDRIFAALESVFENPLISKDVRRVACECLSRFPGARPWRLFLSLISSLNEATEDLELIRAAVYGMCHSLMTRISQEDFSLTAFPPVATKIIMDCASNVLIRGYGSHVEDVSKFVMGAQEFLTLALVTEGFLSWENEGIRINSDHATQPPQKQDPVLPMLRIAESKKVEIGKVTEVHAPEQASTKRPISEVVEPNEETTTKKPSTTSTSQADMPNIQMILTNLRCGHPAMIAFSTSVLCSVARALFLAATFDQARQQEQPVTIMAGAALMMARISVDRATAAAQGLARLLTEEIMAWWSKDRPPVDEELAVLFNVAFTCTKKSKSFLRPSQLIMLINACLGVVQGSGEVRKTHALKLLGLLLVVPEEDASILAGDGTLARIEAALRSVANLDPSHEARTLASSLLAATFEKVE